ncbi:MAG: hypothetical protein QM572_03350 [Nocardioides sp.]|uniref:hypothetical protein n=1 Tax=Nocardioides sp. TaxID=35761 RepID=UPI0039E2F952
MSTTPAGSSSGTTSVPHTDVKIDEVSSLFDIPAPEGSVTAAPSTPAGPAAPAAPATGVATDEAPAPEATDVASEEGPSTEDTDASADEPPAEEEATESPTETDAIADTATEAKPATPAVQVGESSGATHEPRTDVDIHGADSLFDL